IALIAVDGTSFRDDTPTHVFEPPKWESRGQMSGLATMLATPEAIFLGFSSHHRPDVFKAGRQPGRAAGGRQVSDSAVHLSLVGLEVADPLHHPVRALAPVPDHGRVAGYRRKSQAP